MNKRSNIFVSFLELLNVKHTKEFSNQYFNEHPYRNNLYKKAKQWCPLCLTVQVLLWSIFAVNWLYCHSVIRFGNPQAPTQLTILSNPYCNPCARMHKRIEEFLQKTNNNNGIQCILSSFKVELNTTNKYLIAACLAEDRGFTRQIITELSNQPAC